MSEQAKKLTAAQRKVLERMAAGDVLVRDNVTNRLKFQDDQERQSLGVFDRLLERHLIRHSGEKTEYREYREAIYALTDSGRAALRDGVVMTDAEQPAHEISEVVMESITITDRYAALNGQLGDAPSEQTIRGIRDDDAQRLLIGMHMDALEAENAALRAALKPMHTLWLKYLRSEELSETDSDMFKTWLTLDDNLDALFNAYWQAAAVYAQAARARTGE